MIKMIGIAADIFQDALLPFLPMILNQIEAIIKEGIPELMECIAWANGELIKGIFIQIEDEGVMNQRLSQFNPVIAMIFTQQNSKSRYV